MRLSIYRALMVVLGIAVLSGEVVADTSDAISYIGATICVVWWFFLGFIFGGYTYKDAKRRDMNRILWPIVSFAIPIGGFLFYYAVRNPLPGEGEKKPLVIQREVIKEREIVKIKCPYCGALIDQGVNNCPHCGAPLK